MRYCRYFLLKEESPALILITFTALLSQKKKNMTEEIKKAVEVLRAGGVILYPTDTIWGLGCDASNEKAVQRIYEIKKRSDAKSMLVLLDNVGKLQGYVDEVPDIAWDLVELADKPLTIIYPNAKNLAPNLLAADKSIGIRITNEAFSKRLCESFRKPIVSTSANISGSQAPAIFSEISKDIISQVDYVVNFRQNDTTKSKPSSILKLGVGSQIEIIRE